MSPQHPQLPSINLVPSDQHRTILPNLSYPFRPNAHIPWAGSSAPLVFTKTTRPEISNATSTPTVQAPPADIYFDTSSVPDAFHGISLLIWHNWSMIVRKLKLIKQRLFGARAASSSVASSV